MRRYDTLDGLRGIAALIVALGHLAPALSDNFVLAVDFFFILSGFVLYHSYAGRLDQGLGFGAFFLARIIRLLPMIVVGTLLGALAMHQLWGLEGMLLVPEIGPQLYPLDQPEWSLLFEMIASALLGLGLWRGSMRSVVVMAAFCAVLISVAVIHSTSIDRGWQLATFHYGIVRVLFGFGVGVLLYRLRLPFSLPAWLVCLALAAVLTFPVVSSFYQLAALLVFLPALIVVGSNANRFVGATLLGEMSYPLYIVHDPIFRLMHNFSAPIALGVVLLSAFLLLQFVDKPVRSWLTRKFSSHLKSRPSQPAIEEPTKIW